MMSGLLSPDTGYFRLFSLFSFWRASARLHLKKKKSLENFSVSGAGSFYGADFCHNDKEAAVNTWRIYKAFAKVRAKIRPLKPMRVRISSAMDSIHPFWTFFPIPKGCKKAENIINNTLKDNENTEVELRSHKLNFGVLLIFDKKRFPGWQKNAFVLE